MLLSILSQIVDPRKAKGKRHPLVSILALIIIGFLCGHTGYTSIATWARNEPELAEALGFRCGKTPCPATIHNLFKHLDIESLETALTEWVSLQLAALEGTDPSGLKGIAIDGKELCGSIDIDTGRRTHLLSAVCHELGVTLAQCAVSHKTNEIPISRQLLEKFDVKGKVVTTDALLTQRAFCKELIKQKAYYVLRVKKNQKQMYIDIVWVFAPLVETDPPEVQARRLQNAHTQAGAHLQTHTDVEETRGFIITRILTASTSVSDYIDWPGLAQVYQYKVQRVNTKTGECETSIQYGITNLSPEEATAEDLLKLHREHWTIENKSHWVRDVVLGEDASKARTGSIPQVMAALRNTALAVLRFAGYTKITETIRSFASKPKLAVNLIT